MFGSKDIAGQVVSLQLVPNNSTFIPLAIGNTPWTTAMLTLNNQLVGVVFNPGDLKFSVVPIPIPSNNPAPLWTLPISGLTPLNQISSPPNGGWPLAVAETAAKAAILSWADKKIAIVDLLAKTQTQTVALSGHLLQMATDNAHGKVIVVTANISSETSSFIAIDLATGSIQNLNATAPFYCTGFGVSQDGTQLYCGGINPKDSNRFEFKIIPNQ